MLAAYTISIFLSAFLVFLVQPMVGKIFLPWVGGAPSSWNTCMFFFQLLLLGGYYYAHVSLQKLKFKTHLAIHFALMLLAIVSLPIAFKGSAAVPEDPSLWLLQQIFFTVAIPYFVVSSTAPILQKWFYYTEHKRSKNPFFLYAASNTGSLLALLAYPFVLEPNFNLATQGKIWAAGYGLLILSMIWCAFYIKTAKADAEKAEAKTDNQVIESIPETQILTWVIAAFVPSSLFLGVTHFLTRNVAPVPMLWIVPLTIYLLTFIISFSEKFTIKLATCRKLAFLGLALFFPVFYMDLRLTEWYAIPSHLYLLFAVSMLCHKYLADNKPHAQHLTSFYLWLSVGGVLGGLFNSYLAPTLFSNITEYPIAVLLSTYFLINHKDRAKSGKSLHWTENTYLVSIFGGIQFAIVVYFFFNTNLSGWFYKAAIYFGLDASSKMVSTIRSGLDNYYVFIAFFATLVISFVALHVMNKLKSFNHVVFAATVMTLLFFANISIRLPIVMHARNFFGTKRIYSQAENSINFMVHGTTIHGLQSFLPGFRSKPLAYFHKNGPFGDIFSSKIGQKKDLNMCVIGLGPGAVAAYIKPGQNIDFYEIDPQIAEMAESSGAFTYLSDCLGSYSVIIGDGRLKMLDVPDQHYDIIFMDAFSSSFIPAHLATVEAMGIYLQKLKPEGLIVFNITNKHLQFTSLIAALGDAHDLHHIGILDSEFDESLAENFMRYPCRFAVLSPSERYMPTPETRGMPWKEINANENIPVWTDHFSSLLPVIMHGK